MDPRQNRPSASGISRIALCPGSFQLERLVPQSADSRISATGTEGHGYFAELMLGRTVEIPDDQKKVIHRATEQAESLLARVFMPGENIKKLVEHRLYYKRDFVTQFSAQMDFAALSEDEITALLIDAKTGWKGAPPAQRNWQILTGVVLLKRYFPKLENVYAAIVQPNVDRVPDVVHYDAQGIALAEKELLELIEAADDPQSPRQPSPEACALCRAKSICPEAIAYALSAPAQSALVEMTPEQRAEILDKITVLEGLAEDIRDRAHVMLLEDPHSIPGYTLGPSRGLSLTRLEDEYRKEKAVTVDEAKESINNILGGLLKDKQFTKREITDIQQAKEVMAKHLTAEGLRYVTTALKRVKVDKPKKPRKKAKTELPGVTGETVPFVAEEQGQE